METNSIRTWPSVSWGDSSTGEKAQKNREHQESFPTFGVRGIIQALWRLCTADLVYWDVPRNWANLLFSHCWAVRKSDLPKMLEGQGQSWRARFSSLEMQCCVVVYYSGDVSWRICYYCNLPFHFVGGFDRICNYGKKLFLGRQEHLTVVSMVFLIASWNVFQCYQPGHLWELILNLTWAASFLFLWSFYLLCTFLNNKNKYKSYKCFK